MKNLENRSPFIYILVGLVLLLMVAFVVKTFIENGAILFIGLGWALEAILLSFLIPSKWQWGRSVVRFAALQSACAGIYLWGARLQHTDIEEWFLYFVLLIFAVLPATVAWTMKR